MKINIDFWNFFYPWKSHLIFYVPPYIFTLFFFAFLCYIFVLFFPAFFSENSHWFLFLLPIFPLILFIFIFATTAENLLIKTSAIWKSLVVSLGIPEYFFRKCLEKTADRVECAKCRQIKYWSCNNLYPAKWQFLDHFCIPITYLSFSKRQVKYLQSINFQKIFEIFFFNLNYRLKTFTTVPIL